MKVRMIILLAIGMMLVGCKQNNWLDWKAENQAWLEQNLKQDSVKQTESKLQYLVLRQGLRNAAAKPDALKTVNITYTCSLINGYVVDQGENVSFTMTSLIDGVSEGLKMMYVSGHYILYIPYDLAYGESGKGQEGSASYIPPYSTIIFDVTLNSCY